MRHNLNISLTAIALTMLLTGCFTGIESTKKITARDVRRQHAATTPEMLYAACLTGDTVGSWQPGKLFMVTSDRLSYAMSPVDVAARLKPGDYLSFTGTRAVPSMTGTDDTFVMLADAHGDTLTYRVQAPPSEVLGRPSLEIPFTIEMSVVDKASRLLTGNDYYITTPVWFNDNGDNITGRKLVKVHVDRVTAGNDNYPVAVHFTDDRGNSSQVFMSTGSGRRSTRNFDTLFSLTNPRDRYKDIQDDVWECITRGTVKIDMTPEECRLSLGNPVEVARGHYLERWRYDTGITLIFDDGHLQQVRR